MADPAVVLSLCEAAQQAFGRQGQGCAEMQPIADLKFLPDEVLEVEPQIPAHQALLDQAVSHIVDPDLCSVRDALLAAKEQLHWRVDDGGFYPKDADVGQGYLRGNMHALLVGPERAPFYSADLLMGFFLLAPHVLYRDHNHLAPEAYLPLTGPTGWRFGQGPWRDMPANQLIVNAPLEVHATRVDAVPFLALFAWTQDISARCNVIPASDWERIDADLARARHS